MTKFPVLPARITRLKEGRAKTRALTKWIDDNFLERPLVMPRRIVKAPAPEHHLQRVARMERERIQERIDRLMGIDHNKDKADRLAVSKARRRGRRRK